MTVNKEDFKNNSLRLLVVVGVMLGALLLATGTGGAVKTISSCQEIDVSNAPSDGRLILDGNISASGDCIEIKTSDITLDGLGNTITGSNQNGIGIEVNATSQGGGATNVDIHDVKVRNFDKGIQYDQRGLAQASGNTTNVNVTDNSYGVFGLGAVPVNVTDSRVVSNDDAGAQGTFSNSLFKKNKFKKNDKGIRLLTFDSNKIIDNEFVGEKNQGIYLDDSSDNKVKNNTISSNSIGVLVEGGAGNSILENNVTLSSNSGIEIKNTNGAVVDDNSVTDNNQDRGIGVSAGIFVNEVRTWN